MLISRQTTLENKFFKLAQDKAHPNTVFSCSQASRKFLFQELPLQTRMQSEPCAKKSNSLQVQKESWKTSDNQVRKKKNPHFFQSTVHSLLQRTRQFLQQGNIRVEFIVPLQNSMLDETKCMLFCIYLDLLILSF